MTIQPGMETGDSILGGEEEPEKREFSRERTKPVTMRAGRPMTKE
jgi:hypothetical protein